MKVIIIGFGSIGKRHFGILNNFDEINTIDLVTRQSIKDIKTFISIEDVENLEYYDYFVIASETVKHYDQLKYICSKVQSKKILVEKPLYDKHYNLVETTNSIFTAYNLRFHPILEKVKELIKDDVVYFANIMCGQYLPSWRVDQDYTKSYSADIQKGGGVLRDLSHELDYASWLFGNLRLKSYVCSKVSDLKINSDDIFTSIFVTEKRTIVNLTIDYISKNPIRKLIIHTQNNTIEADVINNSIIISDRNSNLENIKIDKIDRNDTYSKMHKSILNNKCDKICTFKEGLKTVDIIDSISFTKNKDL